MTKYERDLKLPGQDINAEWIFQAFSRSHIALKRALTEPAAQAGYRFSAQ